MPGGPFSKKVPKLFGRFSGDKILFVSSRRRRPKAENFAVILILIPFGAYEKTSSTEEEGRSVTDSFSGLSINGPQVREPVAVCEEFYSKLLKIVSILSYHRKSELKSS